MYFVFFNFFIFHLLFSIYGLWIEDGKERRSWKDQHPQHRYVAQIHAEHYRYPSMFYKQINKKKIYETSCKNIKFLFLSKG